MTKNSPYEVLYLECDYLLGYVLQVTAFKPLTKQSFCKFLSWGLLHIPSFIFVCSWQEKNIKASIQILNHIPIIVQMFHLILDQFISR